MSSVSELYNYTQLFISFAVRATAFIFMYLREGGRCKSLYFITEIKSCVHVLHHDFICGLSHNWPSHDDIVLYVCVGGYFPFRLVGGGALVGMGPGGITVFFKSLPTKGTLRQLGNDIYVEVHTHVCTNINLHFGLYAHYPAIISALPVKQFVRSQRGQTGWADVHETPTFP